MHSLYFCLSVTHENSVSSDSDFGIESTYMRFHGHLNKGEFAKWLKDLPDVISGKIVEKITDVKSVIRNRGIGVAFLSQNGRRSRQASENGSSRGQRARSKQRKSEEE